ncbi:hypothetical protein [Paenibacillus sp. UASWS1643]|uniref:hypothetical protein n=1 Tax=Paenibacillus sp. UASWS1643 TaxID=2580422 RepID=UPI00123B1B30|nr:hypothetical protein [Paenibacillus sp. UASWS1643]KAA8750162.1 hypothetical protein FE296_16340 [Paenibacillus sp. UASWS1643]
MTNITVLKDENLSGAGRVVEREYREVKRWADVGEYVKVTTVAEDYGPAVVDSIGKCTRNDQFDDGSIDTTLTHDSDGFLNTDHTSYVTLEPSDIIRINGARFRMVDRKATVGERVIIIDAKTATDAYRNGNIMTVNRLGNYKDGVYTDETWVFVYRSEYRVLEPVESAESAQQPEPLSAKPAPEQAAEIIAALTTRVASLERRVSLLEVANAKPTPRRADKPASHPSFTKCTIKSPQEIRDDIVKRAKDDVSRLIDEDGFAHRRGGPFNTVVIEEFVVNRGKRTVVVLGFEAYGNRKKRALGFAKCAPGDVFNVWIGKVVALRRALGLEIPEEYVSAPQPTEVRVGDIVKYGASNTARVAAVVADFPFTNLDTRKFTYLSTAISCDASIIDDSRESDSAEPRKEVA